MAYVLVTGAAGFIGSHCCEELLARGESVLAIDNFFGDYEEKYRNLANCMRNPEFKLFRVSVTNIEDMREVLQGQRIDRIVHLAGLGGVRASFENPSLYMRVNFEGTKNVLDIAHLFKVRNVVFSSSSSVYGLSDRVPFTEDMETESMISPYAESKRKAEFLCEAYSNQHGLNIAVFRLFTVLGKRARKGMAGPLFMEAIRTGQPIRKYGTGDSCRDYVHVQDVVKAIIKALDLRGFEIINIGSSNPVPLNDFISSIEKIVGRRAVVVEEPPHRGDVPITFADISKARKLLGFQPSKNYVDALRELHESL